MFKKKYIFETRSTRSKRLIETFAFSFVLIVICFGLLCAYIPIYAKKQNESANHAFFQKAPDLIAVFTGDSGRIALALEKAKQYPSARVFITGVYAKNNLSTLLVKQGRNISVDEYLEEQSHHIELDYLARNTIENGLATLHYIEKMGSAKRVLIISSDYHMFRISKIMNTLNQNPETQFFYESIETSYTNYSNIKKLVKEVYKFFKSSTFLLFWD